MKPILEYIKLNDLKNKHIKSYFLDSWKKYGGLEYIPSEILYQYILEALDDVGYTANEIYKEISKYDNKADAWRNNLIPKYIKFEEKLTNIISKSEYNKKENHIIECFFKHVTEILEEII